MREWALNDTSPDATCTLCTLKLSSHLHHSHVSLRGADVHGPAAVARVSIARMLLHTTPAAAHMQSALSFALASLLLVNSPLS